MNQAQVSARVREFMDRNFREIYRIVSQELGVPSQALRIGHGLDDVSGTVMVLVDASVQYYLSFSPPDEESIPRIHIREDIDGFPAKGSGFYTSIPEAANYSPKSHHLHKIFWVPGLIFYSEKIASEAKEIGITDEALLDILCMHEMVHMIMMAGHQPDGDGGNWTVGIDPKHQPYRHIHEACALRVNESFIENIQSVANKDDVQRYLDFIKGASDPEGDRPNDYYQEYFRSFQALDDEDFMRCISAKVAKAMSATSGTAA